MGRPGGDAGLRLLMGRSTRGGGVSVWESRHNEHQRQILRHTGYLWQGAGVQQQDACWDTRRGEAVNARTRQSWLFHSDHMECQSIASESPKRLQIWNACVRGQRRPVSPPVHTCRTGSGLETARANDYLGNRINAAFRDGPLNVHAWLEPLLLFVRLFGSLQMVLTKLDHRRITRLASGGLVVGCRVLQETDVLWLENILKFLWNSSDFQ